MGPPSTDLFQSVVATTVRALGTTSNISRFVASSASVLILLGSFWPRNRLARFQQLIQFLLSLFTVRRPFVELIRHARASFTPYHYLRVVKQSYLLCWDREFSLLGVLLYCLQSFD